MTDNRQIALNAALELARSCPCTVDDLLKTADMIEKYLTYGLNDGPAKGEKRAA